jgi:hypothetical protein
MSSARSSNTGGTGTYIRLYPAESDAPFKGVFKLELVPVEYVVPFAIRADDQTPPILLGQEFRRNYTFDVWALHAWAWRDNSSGVFSDWNPDISCEAVG